MSNIVTFDKLYKPNWDQVFPYNDMTSVNWINKYQLDFTQAMTTFPFQYKGEWNAATNTPTIGQGGVGGLAGDMYKISVAGDYTNFNGNKRLDGNDTTGWILGNTFSRTQEEAHSGSWSLKSEAAGTSETFTSILLPRTSQVYAVSMWVKGANAIGIGMYDIARGVSGGNNFTTATSSWTRIGFIMNAQAGNFFKFSIYDNGTTLCYFDDLYICIGNSYETGQNLVNNPSFEEENQFNVGDFIVNNGVSWSRLPKR